MGVQDLIDRLRSARDRVKIAESRAIDNKAIKERLLKEAQELMGLKKPPTQKAIEEYATKLREEQTELESSLDAVLTKLEARLESV